MEMEMKLIQKEIKAKRDFANVAEKLCEVVQKFNGKVFNKRLETAMREVYPIKIEQEYFWKSISITGYIEDRMVQSDDVDKFGYHNTAYIKDCHIYVGIIRDAYDDDKRIVADNICEKIRSTAEYERKMADKIEEQIARIDEIKADCKRIREERNRFNHEVASQIIQYFNLEV